ncbi:MAG: outer membrane protein assembly factor BamB family protein [Pirellulales bacterium]
MRTSCRLMQVLGNVALFVAVAVARAAEPGGQPSPATYGWRGNWTGIFPQADPPTQWRRVAKGLVSGMTCQSAKPADGASRGSQAVDEGLIRDWLVLGPLPVADSVKDFTKEQIPGEADAAPAEGEKLGQLAWHRLELKKKPDYDAWGTTELAWLDVGEALGYKPNHVAYAHVYLHSPRPGKVAALVEHGYGLKLWLNGRPLYEKSQQVMALGSYVGISRQKQALTNEPSPRVDLELRQGWNRLLVKVGGFNQSDYRSMKFAIRLVDAQPVRYEQESIVWATELPERTNAAPLVVGDRIFTPAEPDELLCLDKQTGRILWRRVNGYYEATPESQRAGNPSFAKIAPLAERLVAENDFDKGLALRREIRDLLWSISKKEYKPKWDGHLEAHFAIVGFTTTPVSDGKHVWAFFGNGVVACYDLEGNRRWITRLPAEEVAYSCSPALIGDKLVVLFGGLNGLDAATGKLLWSQPEAKSIASLIPATFGGVDVAVTRSGEVFRAADGKSLWTNPYLREGDSGWAAPLILDRTMYLPWIGISGLIVADFSDVRGEKWEPKVRMVEVASDHRRPNGEWLDRFTPSSPVVHQGVYYNVDQYGIFYAVDLASGKTLYKQDLGFDELHHYNAIGVGASVAMAGKYLYVIDNQGCCAVLEPGLQFRRVAFNRIESPLPRIWPIPPQEILANASPVFEGQRMYLRGEKHLFCIGR